MADSICSVLDCALPIRALGKCHRHWQQDYRKNGSRRVLKPCGTTAAYQRGCRCEECCEANRARTRGPNGKPFSPATNGPHGASRYDHLGCRCQVCTDGNNERARQWRAANRERVRSYNQRSYARRKGLKQNRESRDYAELIRRDPCAYCGEPGQSLDHIVPINAGGSNDWTNLTSACIRCNCTKSDRFDALQFMLHLANTLEIKDSA